MNDHFGPFNSPFWQLVVLRIPDDISRIMGRSSRQTKDIMALFFQERDQF